MRWLIVGPYVPEQGSGPAAAAAAVSERLAAGDTVHVVSPRPTAAHAHLPLDGVRAMWAMAKLARAERADGIWLRVEPGILLQAGAERRQALTERLALSVLLGRFTTSVLDVGDVGLLPGGRAGKPVFAAATRFETHSERDTAALVGNGAPAAKVTQLEAGATSGTEPASPVGPVTYPPADVLRDLPGDRSAIETALRARADELRAARTETAPGA